MNNTKRKSRLRDFSFWLGCRDFALDFCSTFRICFNVMFRKNLRSPFKNSALCCFFTAFESHYIHTSKTKEHPLLRMLFYFGWGAGIRTPVMSESESDALPLGDTPIFSTLTLYHTFLNLSRRFCRFFEKISIKIIFFSQC